MELNDQQFIAALRSALHYLYEPDQLHRSPLIDFLGLSGRLDATLALRQIILDAIESLKPEDDDSPQSSAWRFYDLLYFRYVRGYERLKVANQLGISDRQMARDQKNAIEALALYLWKTYQLESSQAILPRGPGDPKAISASESDISWVESLPIENPAPWKSILLSVMDLLRPLIRENDLQVRYEPEETLPDLLVSQVAVRHSMLTILGWMIPQARNAGLILTPDVQGETVVFTVQIPGLAFADRPLDPEIEVACKLIERVGGGLNLVTGASPAEIRLTIPALAQIPVLVIDDNPDTIQLFKRYVQGTRYAVVGLQNPGEALQTIEKITPRILLIDVMMPEIDGWDLLTELRLNDLARNTAVLMCSILPQEALARSLGADGFLQKPVLPQDFLDALDRILDQFPQEPDL